MDTEALFGMRATFSVSASASPMSTLTYQWWEEQGLGMLSNGAKFDGVTTNTLTVMNINAEDNGLQFSVDISEGGPPISSAVATLTVTCKFDKLNNYR